MRRRNTDLTAGLLILAVVVLMGFAARVAAGSGRSFGLDRALQRTREGWLTAAAGVVQTAFFNYVGAGVMVLVVLALLAVRRIRRAAQGAVLFVAAVGLTIVLRAALNVPRPPLDVQAVAQPRSPSFPSGHVVVAAALTGVLLLALTGTARLIAGWLGVLTTAMVGFSRLYLGVHTLLDVTGAVLLVVGTYVLVRAASPAEQTRTAPVVSSERGQARTK